MKVIKTQQFERYIQSSCWDDQPNFETTRDRPDQVEVLYEDVGEIQPNKRRKTKRKQQFTDRVPADEQPHIENMPKGNL